MAKKQYSEEQIIKVLKEMESGVNTEDLCRQHGICAGTLYRWKDKYGGMTVSDAHRLRGLEVENGRLKRIVADLTLDNSALKGIIANAKNF